jgi:hypothetical protein
MMGLPEQSAERCKLALTELPQLANPLSSVLARTFLSNLLWLLGDRQLTTQLVEQVLARVEQHGLPIFLAHGLFQRAWASSSDVAEMTAQYEAQLGQASWWRMWYGVPLLQRMLMVRDGKGEALAEALIEDAKDTEWRRSCPRYFG